MVAHKGVVGSVKSGSTTRNLVAIAKYHKGIVLWLPAGDWAGVNRRGKGAIKISGPGQSLHRLRVRSWFIMQQWRSTCRNSSLSDLLVALSTKEGTLETIPQFSQIYDHALEED